MKTNMNLFKITPALVLVGFMIGCGGNTASDNTLPKGDGNTASKSKPENNSSPDDGKAATDTANKAKATKFTPEMVKAAQEAAIKQLPDLFTKEELVEVRPQMMDPEGLQRMAEKLNKAIVDGKIDDRGLKVDAVTVEALTKALVVYLPEAKREGDKRRRVAISVNNAMQLFVGLSQASDLDQGKLPVADKWCDAILQEVGSLAVFLSPQHPDTAKLKTTLLNGGALKEPQPNDDAVTAPPSKEATKSKPIQKEARISHYSMNKAMSGMPLIDPKVVLVFECDLGWNGAGGLNDALKYMDKHKLEEIAVVTVDADRHVVTREDLKKLKWTPEE